MHKLIALALLVPLAACAGALKDEAPNAAGTSGKEAATQARQQQAERLAQSLERIRGAMDGATRRPATREEQERLRRSADRHLIDGLSARYESVTVVQLRNGEELFCGLVNAKNRLGAYVGFQPFVLTSMLFINGAQWPALVRATCIEPFVGNPGTPSGPPRFSS